MEHMARAAMKHVETAVTQSLACILMEHARLGVMLAIRARCVKHLVTKEDTAWAVKKCVDTVMTWISVSTLMAHAQQDVVLAIGETCVKHLANMDILEKNVLKDAWKHVLGATMSTGCVILDVFRDGLDTSAIKLVHENSLVMIALRNATIRWIYGTLENFKHWQCTSTMKVMAFVFLSLTIFFYSFSI